MDLEFHQLDCRYESLRVRQPERERRLLASLADHGQQTPIVIVRGGEAYVVVDGYKRVRCLKRLRRDSVAGFLWEMSEPDALILRQMVHAEGGVSALEQGWLLRALHEGHALRLADLARRFDRSVSWVSRRLALTRELPEAVQERVREGRIVPHAAMKYLVPLARANEADCLRLVEAIQAPDWTLGAALHRRIWTLVPSEARSKLGDAWLARARRLSLVGPERGRAGFKRSGA